MFFLREVSVKIFFVATLTKNRPCVLCLVHTNPVILHILWCCDVTAIVTLQWFFGRFQHILFGLLLSGAPCRNRTDDRTFAESSLTTWRKVHVKENSYCGFFVKSFFCIACVIQSKWAMLFVVAKYDEQQ